MGERELIEANREGIVPDNDVRQWFKLAEQFNVEIPDKFYSTEINVSERLRGSGFFRILVNFLRSYQMEVSYKIDAFEFNNLRYPEHKKEELKHACISSFINKIYKDSLRRITEKQVPDETGIRFFNSLVILSISEVNILLQELEKSIIGNTLYNEVRPMIRDDSNKFFSIEKKIRDYLKGKEVLEKESDLSVEFLKLFFSGHEYESLTRAEKQIKEILETSIGKMTSLRKLNIIKSIVE